jgi:hypothetical protein
MDTSQAYSIQKFCENHDISKALFYKLRKEGKAPATIKLGRRTLVTIEAAQAWRHNLSLGQF